MSPFTRINRYSQWLKKKFGKPIRKISINAGFTCPNRDGLKGRGGCTYCNNESFFNNNVTDISPKDQLLKGIEKYKKHKPAYGFIAYLQPYSNTYKPIDELRMLYRTLMAVEEVVGLSIGTRPDCVTEETVKLLNELASEKYVCLEIGLQSAYDATLKKINRGHSFKDFTNAMEICSCRCFDIAVHVILGLPGETKEMMIQTVLELNKFSYNSIKIHNLHIVKNTPMEKAYRDKNIELFKFNDYITTLCDIIQILPPHVIVQRISGEASPNFLIAPEWCLNKHQIYQSLEKELEKRKTYQGIYYKKI